MTTRIARTVPGAAAISARSANETFVFLKSRAQSEDAIRVIRVVIRVSWQFGCPWPLGDC
jgi:hypothetical protein